MTTFEALNCLSITDIQRPQHAIASAVIEYAAEVVASDPTQALRILTLGSELRTEAHEIDAGEPASEVMDRLLVAASVYQDDGEFAAMYRVRGEVDSILAGR